MGESSTNIWNPWKLALNSLKNSDLVQKILDLKGKAIVYTDLHKVSNQIHKFTEAIVQISSGNGKLYNWTGYHKKCYSRLEETIITLEKKKNKWKGNSIAGGIM